MPVDFEAGWCPREKTTLASRSIEGREDKRIVFHRNIRIGVEAVKCEYEICASLPTCCQGSGFAQVVQNPDVHGEAACITP